MIVGHPYDTLYARYGVCCHHDNRPSYMRLEIECRTEGERPHQVVHLVQCQTNQRGAIFIARDILIFLQLVDLLDYPPSKGIEIEICDLNAFLLSTRQRRVVNHMEKRSLRAIRKRASKLDVPITIKLGDYSFSRELVEYIEDIIENNKTLTPTFERMGFANKRHLLKVTEARQRLNLWK